MQLNVLGEKYTIEFLILISFLTIRIFFVSDTFTGAKGNLTERSDYILANVLVTVISVLLVIYFLTYQTYVMRADVITSSILIVAYGVDGLVALSMLTLISYTSHDVVTSFPDRN
uniref:Uncharacterized protein n=1 Tax=Takifugu rubripes TaxID=31033 RepID=A0A3B5KNQ3_TAKRU